MPCESPANQCKQQHHCAFQNSEVKEKILQASREKRGGEKSDKQKMRKQNSSDCLAVQDWKLEDLRQGTVYPERSATQNTCPQSDHQSHRRVKENTSSGNARGVWIPKTKAQTNKQETWPQETGATSQESWVLKKEGSEAQPGNSCSCLE